MNSCHDKNNKARTVVAGGGGLPLTVFDPGYELRLLLGKAQER